MNTTFATMPVVVQVRPKGAGPFYWPHLLAVDVGDVHEARCLIVFDWASISADVVYGATSSSLSDTGEPGENDPGISISGYAAGYHRESAVPWSLVEQVIDAWFDAHDEENWLWEFQLVFEPAHHLARGAADSEADADRGDGGQPGPRPA